MMTKTQYAKYIIKQFREDNDVDEDVPDAKLSCYIYSSSSLAVAMEFLGLLSIHDIEYSQTRGGCVAMYAHREDAKKEPEIAILSVREMLSLLPD